MTGPYLSNAATYLIDLVFGLYIGAVLVRFLLQWARADFYNPVCQLVVRITNPPLRPLRRYIPGFKGTDLAALALAMGLQLIASLLTLLVLGMRPGPLGLLVYAAAELLTKFYYIEIFAILVMAIASWIAPANYNPFLGIMAALSRPLVDPVARRMPNLGGIDLSPLVVLILLQLFSMLFIAPLRDFGVSLLQ